MKSKVLFVYPDYNYLPISPAYVIPVLKKYDISYDYLDLHRDPDLTGALKKGNYTHIATTGLILDYKQVEDIFQQARAFDESIGTILGGRISACPDHILERMPVDYVIVEDADPTFGELMEAIDAGITDFSAIKSIIYRKDGKLVRTERRKHFPLNNFDAAWEDVDMDYYISANLGNNFWIKGFPLVSGLGCVGKCTFCAPGVRGIRTRPVDDIISEMKWADQRFDFNYFCFISEVFYPSVKDMKAFCKAYKESGLNKPWVCNLRADFDPELLDLVADAGCKYIFVGIESFDDLSLQAMGKNTTEKMLRSFIQRALDNGLEVMTGVMAGNLGDTPRTIEKTVDFIIEMGLISYGIASLFVYPGTRVYDEAVRRGVITDEVAFCDSFFERRWDTTISGPNYPNVTGMDLDELRDSFARARYRIDKYMTPKYQSTGFDVDKLETRCRECGEAFSLNRGFSDMYVCTNCLGTNQVNIYYNMVKEHRDFDKLEKLAKSPERLVVMGSHYYIKSLMWAAEEQGADPDNMVFVGGGFHMEYVDNGINFNEVRATDSVLLGGVALPEKAIEALVAKGIPAERILNVNSDKFRRFLENAAKEEDQIYTDTFAEDVSWFGEIIAENLIQEQGANVRWAVAPAGAFGISMCKGFIAAGANVVAMLDSYKQVDDVGIGLPSIHPSDVKSNGIDMVFLATPSPVTQDEIGEMIIANSSLDDSFVVKLKDMYRKYWDQLYCS